MKRQPPAPRRPRTSGNNPARAPGSGGRSGRLKPGVSARRPPAPMANNSTWRVVWRPRCRRPDTAPTRRARSGTRAFSRLLLPTPEGPQSTAIPGSAKCWRRGSMPAPVWADTSQGPYPQVARRWRHSSSRCGVRRSALVSTRSTWTPVASAVSRKRVSWIGSRSGCTSAITTTTRLQLATAGRASRLERGATAATAPRREVQSIPSTVTRSPTQICWPVLPRRVRRTQSN